MEYLTSVDSDAQNSGASNTISYTKEGWKGANTDGYGLATALREDLEVELSGAHIILLGAGGAARGAAMQCVLDQCASLWIGNRTQTLRDKLVRNLRKICPSTITIQPFSLKTLRPKPPAKSVVINATSLGLKPDDGSPLDLKTFPPPAKVYDMIYRPPQTALLRQAAAMGIPNSNGLSMLVHQGAASLEIWTGETAPVAIMHQAVRRAII